MKKIKKKPDQTLSGNLNHFAQLKYDADNLLDLAIAADDHSKVTFTRTSILLYIVSLEILINRVIEEFWPESIPKNFMDDVKRWPTTKKWEEIPKIFNKSVVDKGRPPLQYVKSLFELRNDFVHAKEGTFEVKMNVFKNGEANWEINLPPSPQRYLGINLVKDPSFWLPDDGLRIKKIVDELIDWLDKKLEGKLKNGNWLFSDFYQDKFGNKISLVRNYQKQ